MKRLFTLRSLCLSLGLLLATTLPGFGQLTFDANTGTSGVQNGAGTWDTGTANWWNGTTNVVWDNGVAQFGSTATGVGGTLTINSAISATGLTFLPLLTAPTSTNQAYQFNGTGTLTLTGSNPIINIGNNATSGSSTTVSAVNFLLPVAGTNWTIQKNGGTALGFVRFNVANPGLTGVLTLKGALGGIYMGVASSAVFPALTAIVVEPNSVLQLGGTGNTYTTQMRISGIGGSQWGAIRLDSSITLAGGIVLQADARVHTHNNVPDSFITAPITEETPGLSFNRTAQLPTTTTAPLSMTYTAANTYTGATVLGRLIAFSFPTLPGSSEGGLNILDFSATGAPTANIFYNGVTAGALNLFGGQALPTVVRLKGKDATVNSQTFGNVTVAQNRSEIELISGAGGTVNLQLGAITRTGNGLLSIKAPVSGTITTTTPNAFYGAWSTYIASDGTSSWAAAPSGTLTNYTGDTNHATGVALTNAPTANLRVGIASTGPVTQGAGVTTVNTVSMTDTYVDRAMTIGAGQTLRLGATGGIQVVSGAKSLTLNDGKLTAGGADNTAGQLIFSNYSTNGLTVNSVIDNNGTGATSVFINGTTNTLFNGANTYSGHTLIESGSLEISHGAALGNLTGYTQIMTGSSLFLSGGISVAETLYVSGRGLNLSGAIKNVSGTNTITSEVNAFTNIRIGSDAGTLMLAPSAGLTGNAITGSGQPVVFGGAGDITVNGKLNIAAGTVTKEGTGTLVLAADNAYTGVTTVSAGTLRVTNNNSLGAAATASNTVVSSGATLELSGGVNIPDPITASSASGALFGAIRSASGSNTLSGLVTMGSHLRFQADAPLTFDVATGNAFVHAGTATIIATFGGAATTIMADPIARTSTGTMSILKVGDGTMHIRAASPTVNGTINAGGGILNLDFSYGTATANFLGTSAPGAFSGGVLQITGRSGATVQQDFSGVTVQAGSSELRIVQNSATAVNMALGAITRTVAAGVLRFTPATAGSLTTTSGTNNAILSSDSTTYATVGTNDWAATDTPVAPSILRNIVGLSSITGGYTPTTGGTLPTGNADMTTAAVGMANDQITTSMRFNTTGGSTVTIASGKTLSTGGILVGTGAGAFDSVITGGTIRSASVSAVAGASDFVVIQNNTAGGLVISSIIANNATAATNTGFTKAGPGTLYLDTAVHTFTGTTRVLEGTLHLRSGNLSANTEVTLGSGSASGILKLGSGATAVSLSVDWLRTDGTGAGNAVVGGSTAYSTFTVDNAAGSDFRGGMLGGIGTNEDNLNFRVAAAGLITMLGTANTYKGKTTFIAGGIEATLLANAGTASSLGKGDQNADAAIIDMSTNTITGAPSSAISLLRYIGTTDSVTDRAIRISNTDNSTDIPLITASLENTGTGTVKFTTLFTANGSNPTTRQLRLGGTNTGTNEIVGISDFTGVAVSSVEKYGTGTWIITGDSPHTGATTVTNGILQLGKGGTTGSVATTSQIDLAGSTGILSVNHSGTFTLAQPIIGAGTLRIDNPTGGITRLTGDANTYGATIVQTGILLANNASAASSATGAGSVTVNPGAVLGGSGRIAPAINNSITIIGATVSVGDSSAVTAEAADLTLATSGTGLLSFQAGSIFAFDLFGGVGAGNNTGSLITADRAVISGRVALGTDITFRLTNSSGSTAFAENDSWRLFDWTGLTGSVNGTFTKFELPGLDSGLLWDTSQLYTSGVITIVVPEPSRMLLVVAGLIALGLRRRR